MSAVRDFSLAEILDAMPMPVVMLAPDHSVIMMNRSAREDVQRDGRFYDAISGSLFECNKNPGKCPVYEAVRTRRVQEAVRDFDVGGEVRTFEVIASPVAGENGEPVAVVGIIRDVTDSMLLRSFRQARELMRIVEEAVPDAIITMNASGEVLSANQAVRGIFGVAPEDLRRHGIEMILPPDLRDRHREFMARAAARGRLTDGKGKVETTAVTKERGEVDVELTLAMWNRGGEPMFTAVVRDITERKKIESERQQKHEELADSYSRIEAIKKEWQLILDSVPEPVLMADADDCIVRCNHALAELVGMRYPEIIGRQWKEFVGSRGLEDGDFWGDNLTMVHRETDRVYAVRVNSLMSDGGVPGTVVVFRDVTDEFRMTKELEDAYAKLKQAQSQLLQQEKMASIGQLAAGVAHEINNPVGFIASNLGSMSRYAERLRQYVEAVEERAGDDPELSALRKKLKIDFILDDLGDLVRECIEGTDRVRDIVLNLKSFSRIDQSGEKPADINECIESTLKIVWNELKYKATVEKELGELPLTLCHAQQLNQVFMNLLVNAAQAISDKGKITIRSWCAEGRNGKKSIFVSISDTGCGIPPDQIDRIFEPFYTTKDVGKGTGLGLAIVYDIVTSKHGGDIRVESEVGKGTTFTVEIPVREDGDGDERS